MTDGDCLFSASVVAATSAVELIAFARLAHLAQCACDLFFCGHLTLAFDKRKVLSYLCLIGLIHLEIFLARIVCHGEILSDGRRMVFFHNRSAHATSHARRHLYESVMNVALLDVFERGNAVFYAVDRHIVVAGRVKAHRLENTARCWEESCSALPCVVHFVSERDAFFVEPLCQFFIGQHGVNDALIVRRLVLFCNARSDKHGFCAGVSFLYVRAMRLHGRKHVRKIGQFVGKILLDEKIDRMAARRYDDIALFFSQKSFVFVFYNRCAESGLFNVGKSELFERISHCADAHAFIIGNKRRSERHVHRVSRIDKHSCFFRFVDDLFCVLGANHKAVTAQNAFVAYDVGLVARKAYGFYGAMTNAFVAVFAV